VVARLAGVVLGVAVDQRRLSGEADVGAEEQVRDRRRPLLGGLEHAEAVDEGKGELDAPELGGAVQVELDGVGDHVELGSGRQPLGVSVARRQCV
jgi:hypothetical protein